ncbi:hypothetical protein [Hymenobacter lapidiphilus]|uniref:DUF4279 domain-containing protein n=1 Tax=Hymenobacter lapidiphilus TaxID=2608003 RepID=A0A7Y7U5Q2_9BACT|nr:hypothetical protein [Hymenobacter lapidiphilus]NVO31693.1 hypothetical protein [Hymenobacter lapidiphilus]
MKYHRIFIGYDEPSFDTFNAVSQLMGVEPEPWEKDWFSPEEPNSWSYLVFTDDDAPYFDFINVFLNLLEPKFAALLQLGITKDRISLTLAYLYKHQCALGFDAQEMLRLGASGIGLAIDCFEEKENIQQ